ncbi:MAG: GTP cyclohydrolase II RibA [Rhodospirillaceae bacterium]|nr:GTP cyclohydrolase II RibA [Rhodospirillaceae bacterium]
MPNETIQSEVVPSALASWFGDPGRLSVQRAIGELRAGRPVTLSNGGQALLVAAAEMLGGQRIAQWYAQWHAAAGGGPGLILPAPRLRHLGAGADGPAHLSLAGLSADGIDALLRAPGPPVPPFARRPADALEAVALDLVKRAYLLPAAVVMPAQDDPAGATMTVDAAAVADFHDQSARDLAIAARTRVPLVDAQDAEFVVFRGGDGLRDQVAIVIGHPDPRQPTLARLHSACLTGDLFASLKCDCGDQLRLAVSEISVAGGGVLVYLDQEGRGIGLLNKMRAYGLQALGHDTVDADAVLGYGPDERRYAIAGAMLALLGFRRVVLMTNNPDKIVALEEFGVNVVGHRRLIGGVNRHNRGYLATKAHRAGHMLDGVDRQLPALNPARP